MKEGKKMKELSKVYNLVFFDSDKLEEDGWIKGWIEDEVELTDVEVLEGVKDYTTGEIRSVKLEGGLDVHEGEGVGGYANLLTLKEVGGEDYILGYEGKQLYIISRVELTKLIEEAIKGVSVGLKDIEVVTFERKPIASVCVYIRDVLGLEVIEKGERGSYAYKCYYGEKDKYILDIKEDRIVQEIGVVNYKADGEKIGYECLKSLILGQWCGGITLNANITQMEEYVDILGGLLYYTELLQQLKIKLNLAKSLINQ